MSIDLPPHLLERVRRGPKPPAPAGRFVLYWMRTALRAHDNPALDVALAAGRALGLPVFVYRALSRRTPYANHRHHTFILQGQRDVGRALADRGVGTAFHLERPGHEGPHLRTLGQQAAVVVTEDMPVEPLRGWTRGLARALAAPVWVVDTACLAPIAKVNRCFDRAFAFRDAVAGLQAERIRGGWSDHPVHGAPFVPELPFEPVSLEGDLGPLVAAAEVDPGVGPVPSSVGGTVAGMARWARFRDEALTHYAERRNDPLRPDAVSRMSPYLHYGMVSPFELASEAAQVGGRGADRWLDELLVWRELAWHHCAHTEVHEGPAALPAWARATLAAHRADPRPACLDDETLARGKTGDALWDLCQQSLVRHGELHNNLRMTWGKQLLQWKADPFDALRLAVELNHRYALDGRDPASTGGLLWCFGAFDGPHGEQPILGRVRSRPTSWHRTRVSPERYAGVVRRPTFPGRVAVVGVGLAGAICARTLVDHGVEVVAFDKGRGPGGRMSRRRGAGGDFEHGGFAFTPSDPTLGREVAAWVDAGVVVPWEAGTLRWEGGWVEEPATVRLVGGQGANDLVKHLLRDVAVAFGSRVTGLERGVLTLDGGADVPADVVVLTAPTPQVVALRPGLAEALGGVAYDPCWSVMLRLGREPAEVSGAGELWREGHRLVREHTKPGRGGAPRWTLQLSAELSRAWLERDADDVGRGAADLLRGWFPDLDLVEVSAHRWRYAQVASALGPPLLQDGEVLVAGDGLAGGGIEGALRSGRAAAGAVLLRLSGLSPG